MNSCNFILPMIFIMRLFSDRVCNACIVWNIWNLQ